MDKPVVVLSRPWPSTIMDNLSSRFQTRIYSQDNDLDVFDDALIYITTSLDAVSAELIAALPDSLKLIANAGVGVDAIDLAAARDRGITVSNTPVVTEDTADLAWSLILSASRRCYRAEQLVRSGDWVDTISPDYFGQRVNGKTLGIVGLGAIGEAVARRAQGFDMSVCYYGPNRKREAEQRYKLNYCQSLKDLLITADIVSLHCPLTPATRHIINSDTLAWFKPGAVLVNTGRGALIDEPALTEALQQGSLGAAGLDVFESEPQLNDTLRGLQNVSLLPHIGSATVECRQDMALRLMQNVQQFILHGVVCDPVGGQV